MRKRLYAVIPYLGGEWQVIFKPTPTSSGARRCGYGPLPAEHAKLPTVNFEGNEAVTESTKYPISQLPEYGGDLAAYLDFLVSLGVEVKNWKGNLP